MEGTTRPCREVSANPHEPYLKLSVIRTRRQRGNAGVAICPAQPCATTILLSILAGAGRANLPPGRQIPGPKNEVGDLIHAFSREVEVRQANDSKRNLIQYFAPSLCC